MRPATPAPVVTQPTAELAATETPERTVLPPGDSTLTSETSPESQAEEIVSRVVSKDLSTLPFL